MDNWYGALSETYLQMYIRQSLLLWSSMKSISSETPNICFIFEKYINFPIAKLINKSSQYNFPALCKENFKMHLSCERTFITSVALVVTFLDFSMNRLLLKKNKHFRLTIFLLPLLLQLPPPPHVPSGHPAGGLGPDSGQPHIFTLEPKLGRIKRRGRLRRQGARNSWAITQRLSYTIKRPTVLFFLKCDLGYLCLATLHNYDKRQLRKIASGWGWKVGILPLASCLILTPRASFYMKILHI